MLVGNVVLIDGKDDESYKVDILSASHRMLGLIASWESARGVYGITGRNISDPARIYSQNVYKSCIESA
jgi:hypothetical protein